MRRTLAGILLVVAVATAQAIGIGPIGGGGGGPSTVTVFADEVVEMSANVVNGADTVVFEISNSNDNVVFTSSVQPDSDGHVLFYWYPMVDGTYTVKATTFLNGEELSSTDVSFVNAVRPDAQGFITGGGWFQHDSGRASYGFVAQVLRNGTIRGNLEFRDHLGNHNFHASVVEWVYAPTRTEGFFSGTCTDWGGGEYPFFVHVLDRGEPGTNDLFELWVYDPANGDLLYSYSNVLSGGNIQIHSR